MKGRVMEWCGRNLSPFRFSFEKCVFLNKLFVLGVDLSREKSRLRRQVFCSFFIALLFVDFNCKGEFGTYLAFCRPCISFDWVNGD